jgi:RNA polymerase sigma-70 factor (ECF subfamily)
MKLTAGALAGVPPAEDEARLVELLRAGDEGTFAALIDTYHGALLRLATAYVRDGAVAQDVVQDTWLGVLRGLDRFEGRSSLKAWIFQILVNTAKTWAVRERRTIPLSAVWDASTTDVFEHAVEPERFVPADADRWPRHWASSPPGWGLAPEERLLSSETRSLVHAAINALPPGQRQVVSLRDSRGWTAQEVCNVLQISENNQRVLLHRGRARVRRALERYLTGT